MDTMTSPVKVCCYLWPTFSKFCSVLLFFSYLFAAAASLSSPCLLLQPLSSHSVSSTSHSTAYCLLDSSLNQHNINPPGTPQHCYINASSMLQEHLLKCLENCFRRPWFCSCSTLARRWLKQKRKITANNLKDSIPIMFATSNPIFAYTNLCAVALLKSLGRLWLSAGGKGQNLILSAGATPLHPPWACGAASVLYFSRHACLGRSFYRNCFKYILSHTSMQPKKFKPCSWHSLFQYRWEFIWTICLSHLCFSFTISICSRPLITSHSYFSTSPKRVTEFIILI